MQQILSLIEPAHEIYELVTYESNGGSDEPVLMRGLIIAFATCTCKERKISRPLISEDNLACDFANHKATQSYELVQMSL